MIEAMACGTPVIALRCGSVPEVIDEGITGFIVNDLDEAVKCVETRRQLPPQAPPREVLATLLGRAHVAGLLRRVSPGETTASSPHGMTGPVTSAYVRNFIRVRVFSCELASLRSHDTDVN
jgi:hypothetical protein